MAVDGSLGGTGVASGGWSTIREALHERGLRWTPQRRALLEVLAGTDGHVTGAELVERWRAIDPATIPPPVHPAAAAPPPQRRPRRPSTGRWPSPRRSGSGATATHRTGGSSSTSYRSSSTA